MINHLLGKFQATLAFIKNKTLTFGFDLIVPFQGVLPESGAPSSLGSDGDEEAPVFKKMAEEGTKEEDGEESAPAEDLFSEIHLGQLKKVLSKTGFSFMTIIFQLERQLESIETEKQGLSTNVREVQDNLDSARRDVSAQKARLSALLAFLGDLWKLKEDAAVLQGNEAKPKDADGLAAKLGQQTDWQSRAIAQINSLQENVKSFNIEDMATFDTVTKMKSEMTNLRSDLAAQEKLVGEKIKRLKRT